MHDGTRPPALRQSACIRSLATRQEGFQRRRCGLRRPIGTRARLRKRAQHLSACVLLDRLRTLGAATVTRFCASQGSSRSAGCVGAAAGGAAVRPVLLSHAADVPAARGTCRVGVCRYQTTQTQVGSVLERGVLVHADRAIIMLTHGMMPCAATGDIDEMWIRDSAVQVAIYLPAARRDPTLRSILEGVIFRQAFYILQACSDAVLSYAAPRPGVHVSSSYRQCQMPDVLSLLLTGPVGELLHAAPHARRGVEQQAAAWLGCGMLTLNSSGLCVSTEASSAASSHGCDRMHLDATCICSTFSSNTHMLCGCRPRGLGGHSELRGRQRRVLSEPALQLPLSRRPRQGR